MYMKRKANQTSHVPLWSDVAYEVESISIAHGITFYKTTARDRPCLRHELFWKNNLKQSLNVFFKISKSKVDGKQTYGYILWRKKRK